MAKSRKNSEFLYWIKWITAYVTIRLYKMFVHKRFGSYDSYATRNLEKIGYVVPKVEKEYESTFPELHLQEKADEVTFYGTNSKLECLFVRLSRRPNQKADSWVYLKMADGKTYSLSETEGCHKPSESKGRTFSCGKLQMHYLSPMRRWRIFFCGMLKETSKTKPREVFVKFAFLWKASSEAYDCTLDTNPAGFASAIARSEWKKLFQIPIKKFTETFNFYAQAGNVTGTVSVDDGPEYEMYLFGEKIRNLGKYQLLAGCKFTALLGNLPSNGLRFHLLNSSTPCLFNNLPIGFILEPDGTLQPVKELNINLNQICRKKNSSSFEAKFNAGKRYEVTGNLEKPFVLCSGNRWSGFLKICFVEFTIENKKGAGICLLGEMNEDHYSSGRVIKSEPVPLMPEFIPLTVQLSDEASEFVEISGGKGSSLGKLTRLSEKEKSFIVPKGIVVTTSAYREFLTSEIMDAVKDLENLTYVKESRYLKDACSKVSAIVEQTLVSNELRLSITEGLQNIFGEEVEQHKFAVRSSATGEDTEAMSAAGQMETFLGVHGLENIFMAVKKCWASSFSFRAINYKRRYGQDLNSPMAVIIQEMVDCEASGVMFTCDPVTNNPSIITIQANYGLGETVVSGCVEPDTFILRRKDSIKPKMESIQVGKKQNKITMKESGGIVVQEIDEAKRSSCCLSQETAERLGVIATKIEKFFKSSRDIEWGILNNKMYILQSRPVTNTTAETKHEIIHEFDPPLRCERQFFMNAHVGETFPKATSPLGIEIYSKPWCLFFRRNSLERGLGDNLLQVNYVQPGLQFYSNRIFVSVSEMLSRYGVDTPRAKAFMMGWFGRIIDDPEFLHEAREAFPKKGVKLSLKTKFLLFLELHFFDFGLENLKKKMDNYHLNFLKEKTAKDTYNALIKSYKDFESVTIQHFQCLDSSSNWNMKMFNLLSKEKGNFDNTVYRDFAVILANLSNVESANIPQEMQELFQQIGKDIGHEKFKSMSIEEAENWLKTASFESGVLFQQFLKRHGHRGIQEFDVYSTTWETNPKLLIKTLQSSTGASKQIKKKEYSADEMFSQLNVQLSFISKCFLRFILFNCRRALRAREVTKSVTIKAFDYLRRGYRHLAKLMVSEGRLPDEDLLFFFTLDEIGDLLDTRSPTIISRAHKRRNVFPSLHRFRFPQMMKGLPKPINEESESGNTYESVADLTMKGIPMSQGVVKGYARVTRTLEEAEFLKAGEILIAHSTDIGWSPYFPIISGVVTEIGGLISHGVIISREYGLPCVIGLEGATTKFRTGDYILLDGNKGILQRLPQPEDIFE